MNIESLARQWRSCVARRSARKLDHCPDWADCKRCERGIALRNRLGDEEDVRG